MRNSFSKGYAAAAVAVSAICGFLHALPYLGALPSQAALSSTTRGIAAMQNVPGYPPSSPGDFLNASLWRAGGASLLSWGQWLAVFAGWTIAALAALVIIWAVLRLLNDSRVRKILIASTALLLLATCVPALQNTLAARREKISDIQLLAPSELAGEAGKFSGSEIFATASGQAYLLLFAPHAAVSLPPAESARLSRLPTEWREALREKKWQAVFLAGPLTEYRPILDHLVASPDWHLGSVTNQGYLFLRGAGLPARSIDPTFRLSSDVETAVYLAQIAERYDAIRRSADARSCIERALALAPSNASVLAYAATYAAAHKRWQDAITYSNKALARQPTLAQAKIVQALALLEINEPSKAEALVDEVLLQQPADIYTLFLSARISKARNDYTHEAETLEKIISLSAKEKLPVTHYQIYLGQAYARLGQAKDALRNYRSVIATGNLNKEQKEEIQAAIDTIEGRTASQK